jgi:hypothetical protein
MKLESILDKIFFIKIGDDKSYVCETFMGLPLNYSLALTAIIPFFLNGAMNIIQISVIMLVWFYFLNQTYWFMRVNAKVRNKEPLK